jgi:hypothetical protein
LARCENVRLEAAGQTRSFCSISTTPRLRRVDHAEVATQDRARELAQGSGDLDAGGARRR